jgi:hypothetical protein
MFKRHKLMMILSALILLFGILIISAWSINRYVYDLVHYMPLVTYHEKSLSVIDRTSDNRGDVGERIDLEQIVNDLRKKQDYSVDYRENYDLLIKRSFGTKEYEIWFMNREFDTRKTTVFTINAKGELYYEPDYSIEQRAFMMVDDLPITEIQKNNIKNNIEVRGISTTHWGN